MSATIDKLCKSFRIEPDNEVIAVGDGWNSRTAGKFTPLAQQVHILGDVQLFKIAPVLSKPILGLFAVGSRRCRVNSYLRHPCPPGLKGRSFNRSVVPSFRRIYGPDFLFEVVGVSKDSFEALKGIWHGWRLRIGKMLPWC